ncbi:MAG: ZIP family metal transporter [Thermomicrobiales bacterium]
MLDQLQDLDPIIQAGLAGGFTWAITAAGAAIVLFVRQPGTRFLDTMLGFAAGVMLAASVWSLLIPAIERSEEGSLPAWLPAGAGLAVGAGSLWIIDQILPHIHPLQRNATAEGMSSAWRQTTLLIMAITIHNIPEGLAVGVAFGALQDVDSGSEMTTAFGAAVALAIGIGLQNFPEGISVSLPLRGQGFSRARSLWYGQLSAAVEPVAAIVGALAIVLISPILPWALAFAAGAMVFVVVEELIPQSHSRGNGDLATLGTVFGFIVMMTLDVALG